MAEEQDQIENDEVDETAIKAEEIGKAIGVEDNKTPKDDVPDYEIEEEGDERIAKEREPRVASGERKKLSTKEKRDARNRARERKFAEKDSTIEQLRNETEELRAWRSQVEGRLANVDKGKVDDAIASVSNAFAKAKADHASAFTEGDGEKATAAMIAMSEANTRYQELAKLKQQLDRAPAAPQQNNAPNPKTISKAKAWAAKHDWYTLGGKDEDSTIASSLSQVLADEGFDPSTDKFWNELDKRLVKHGVIDADEIENDEDDYEDEEPAAKKSKKRGSPPVSGGSNRGGDGGKVKITLPTRYVNTLKENGIWDDEKRRNKVIQGYLKARREAAAQ